MPVIVTDNKLCHSVYNQQTKILYSTYKGLVINELFSEHMQNTFKFIKTNKILGSVVDFRKLRGSYLKVFKFLEQEAYPGLKKAGAHYLAFVISDDIIIENVTVKLMEVIERVGGIKARIFTNDKIAEKWLMGEIKVKDR